MTAPSGEAVPDSAAYTRLHITPLDADLVSVVLSSALLPKARSISYHEIETFPEKRYGFLELPTEDAEKLRRKLNGSVLRGVKIRIETAKPSGIPTPLGADAMATQRESKKSRDVDRAARKKRKRDADFEGVVLEEGRQVKRGWTTANEPKDKDKRARKDKKDKKEKSKDKKQPKSKYTDHTECLVKTVLPASAVESGDANDASPKKRKKSKSREVVVHEFERTTKFPTFLKSTVTSSRPGPPLEFVDGKGWVDESGNVVEATKVRPRVTSGTPTSKPAKDSVPGDDTGEDSSTDESVDGDDVEVSQDDEMATSERPRERSKSPVACPSLLKSDPARPRSSGSMKSLTIKVPPTTPKEPKVHPLEALYKRPAPADGVAAQGPSDANAFSFFDNADDADLEEDAEAPKIHVPMTPFTRQDIESRGIRSAAPTPDTAHPSRRFKPWEQEEDIEEDDDEDDDAGSDLKEDDADDLSDAAARPAGVGEDGSSSSDFQKWFWENRGDINRSWRKRRKLVGKEKRYRENRARMARAI